MRHGQGMGRQPGWRINGDGPQIQTATLRELTSQCRSDGIVQVDHGSRQARPVEQRALGPPVRLHAAVEVEVILGEIGKDCGVYLCGIQTALHQTDGRGLHRTGFHALIDHVAQTRLKQDRIGGGQTRGYQSMAAITRQRRATNAQRPDHGAGLASGRQQLAHPPGRRGLAIGAGKGHHIERRAGVGVKGAGHRAGICLERGHQQNPLVVKTERFRAIKLDQHRGYTGLKSCVHKPPPVRGRTRPRDKTIAGGDLPAVAPQGASDAGT